MNIICLTHVDFEGPARLEGWANERGHHLEVLRMDQMPDKVPNADAVQALAIMGGPMSVNDHDEWLLREAKFIEQVLKSDTPVLGVCLGAQMLARIYGARVYAASHKEIGWWPVFGCIDTPKSTVKLPDSFVALHWHGETFDLPSGAVQLASSEAVANQAFQLGSRVLGLQFHIEATPESVSAILSGCAHELAAKGRWVQTAGEISASSQAHCGALAPLVYSVLDQLFKDH